MIVLTKFLSIVSDTKLLFDKQKVFKLDFKILINILLISLIGFAEIFSATVSQGNGLFIKQIFVFVFASLICFSVIPAISLRLILKYSYLFYICAVILLILIFVIGDVSMGARRWINIAGFRLQPSETIKTFLILAIARYLHFTKIDNVGHLLNYPLVLLMIFFPAGLIVLQPDLGTAVIVCLIGLGIIFISGLKYKYVIIVGLVAILAAPIMWINMHDYQKKRVMVFIDPTLDPLGSGYNITQSTIAIGSAGLLGNGYLNGKQSQLNFLPENHTDFIFTHFCEEFGFLGAMILLILYAALFYNIYFIFIIADYFFLVLNKTNFFNRSRRGFF
jgi:rod shape determining protein RodA